MTSPIDFAIATGRVRCPRCLSLFPRSTRFQRSTLRRNASVIQANSNHSMVTRVWARRDVTIHTDVMVASPRPVPP